MIGESIKADDKHLTQAAAASSTRDPNLYLMHMATMKNRSVRIELGSWVLCNRRLEELDLRPNCSRWAIKFLF